MTHLHLLHVLVGAGSSNPFHYVIDFLRGILRTFNGFTGSWGIAIILLTVCVRIVLFPYVEAVPLRPAHADAAAEDQGAAGQVQRRQAAPAARDDEAVPGAPGQSVCPLLPAARFCELPIFFCLYYAIRGTPELREAHFLWLTLGARDPYFILLVFYVVSQLVSTELSLTYTSDPRQKWMMRAMPLFFVVVLLNFPSGLFVYWVTTNLWTVGQQLIIRKTMKTLPATQPAKPRKASRFMEAMTAAQEQRGAQSGGQRSGGKSGQGGRPVKRAPAKVRSPAGAPAANLPANRARARPETERPGRRHTTRPERLGRPPERPDCHRRQARRQAAARLVVGRQARRTALGQARRTPTRQAGRWPGRQTRRPATQAERCARQPELIPISPRRGF